MSQLEEHRRTIETGTFRSPPVDQVGAFERADRVTKRSIKANTKREGLRRVLSMIDLTTLEGMDTPGKVRQMCTKAVHLHDALPGLPTVAAVCVYPNLVSVARESLGAADIRVASVATAFPSGNSNLAVKLAEVHYAVEEGADLEAVNP